MPFVRGVWMRRVSAGAAALALAGLAGCSHVPLVGHSKAAPPPQAATPTRLAATASVKAARAKDPRLKGICLELRCMALTLEAKARSPR